jgi:hypothetical protein
MPRVARRARAQDPNSNDCAKARLSLCITRDALCVPFQVAGANPAAVAAYAAASCPVAPPTRSGVQASAGPGPRGGMGRPAAGNSAAAAGGEGPRCGSGAV